MAVSSPTYQEPDRGVVGYWGRGFFIPKAVVEHPAALTLGDLGFRLLVVLCSYADKEGSCWPAVRTLAEKCGATDRAIRYNLREMERRGILHIEQRITPQGDNTSNRYWILPPNNWEVPDPDRNTGVAPGCKGGLAPEHHPASTPVQDPGSALGAQNGVISPISAPGVPSELIHINDPQYLTDPTPPLPPQKGGRGSARGKSFPSGEDGSNRLNSPVSKWKKGSSLSEAANAACEMANKGNREEWGESTRGTPAIGKGIGHSEAVSTACETYHKVCENQVAESTTGTPEWGKGTPLDDAAIAACETVHKENGSLLGGGSDRPNDEAVDTACEMIHKVPLEVQEVEEPVNEAAVAAPTMGTPAEAGGVTGWKRRAERLAAEAAQHTDQVRDEVSRRRVLRHEAQAEDTPNNGGGKGKNRPPSPRDFIAHFGRLYEDTFSSPPPAVTKQAKLAAQELLTNYGYDTACLLAEHMVHNWTSVKQTLRLRALVPSLPLLHAVAATLFAGLKGPAASTRSPDRGGVVVGSVKV